jgi:hypothetical protein
MGVSLIAGSRAAAQDMPVPVEVQVPLVVKILSFDQARSGGAEPLVLGLVFQSRNRSSSAVAEDVRAALGRVPGVRVVAIDLDEIHDLPAAMQAANVRALYVAPLRAVEVATLSSVTRAGQVVSFTGVPRYVEEGLAVGMEVSGGRPRIVINLAASRAEGARFSSQLLKLVRLTDRADAR